MLQLFSNLVALIDKVPRFLRQQKAALDAGDVEDRIISGIYEHARIVVLELDRSLADHDADPTTALQAAVRRQYDDPAMDLEASLLARRAALVAVMTEARAALRVDGEGRYTTQKRVPAVGEPFEVAKVTAPATLSQACDDAASAMEVKSRARPLGGR